MATGVCGINCDVCGLKTKNICGGCRPGTEFKVEDVTEHPCPLLKCAIGKGIAHCMRDCNDFPCAIIEKGNFPFSTGFIGMQKQRMAKD